MRPNRQRQCPSLGNLWPLQSNPADNVQEKNGLDGVCFSVVSENIPVQNTVAVQRSRGTLLPEIVVRIESLIDRKCEEFSVVRALTLVSTGGFWYADGWSLAALLSSAETCRGSF